MGSEVVPMAVRVDLLGSDWGQPASCRITGLEALSEDQEWVRCLLCAGGVEIRRVALVGRVGDAARTEHE
jgi:hypothetical protein